jgi:Rho GTPase-activating protein 1
MHDISLRAASNLMDAHNLAIVLCPNLIAGSNALRDVSICSVPGGRTMHDSQKPMPVAPEGKSTLGMVIKLCIQRYYEVFDEVHDRSEAIPGQNASHVESPTSSEVSSTTGSLQPNRELPNDDDEDIDDAMLVMPIGPNRTHVAGSIQNGAPSAWGAPAIPYKPRLRRATTSPPKRDARSMHTMSERSNGHGNGNGNNGQIYATINRARSLISIEKVGTGTVGGRGSIAVGRGTSRKSSGAGVEAIGITAEGFFTAPSSAPPVPPFPKT